MYVRQTQAEGPNLIPFTFWERRNWDKALQSLPWSAHPEPHFQVLPYSHKKRLQATGSQRTWPTRLSLFPLLHRKKQQHKLPWLPHPRNILLILAQNFAKVRYGIATPWWGQRQNFCPLAWVSRKWRKHCALWTVLHKHKSSEAHFTTPMLQAGPPKLPVMWEKADPGSQRKRCSVLGSFAKDVSWLTLFPIIRSVWHITDPLPSVSNESSEILLPDTDFHLVWVVKPVVTAMR